MNVRVAAVAAALVVLVGCDEKKETPPAVANSASVSASVPPIASSAPVTASAAPSASAAPASSTSMITGPEEDIILTEKDPAKEPEKTIKAKAGGAVTLFLPDWEGTAWAADSIDKSLGKPKEEMMPGMAPKTMGHQFKWTGLKAGKAKVTFGNRKSGDKTGKPTQTFTLTIDVS